MWWTAWLGLAGMQEMYVVARVTICFVKVISCLVIVLVVVVMTGGALIVAVPEEVVMVEVTAGAMERPMSVIVDVITVWGK